MERIIPGVLPGSLWQVFADTGLPIAVRAALAATRQLDNTGRSQDGSYPVVEQRRLKIHPQITLISQIIYRHSRESALLSGIISQNFASTGRYEGFSTLTIFET